MVQDPVTSLSRYHYSKYGRLLASNSKWLLLLLMLAMAAPLKAQQEIIESWQARKESTTTARAIQWQTSLAAAQEAARRNHKPIFWVHMLGNVDGFT